MCVCVRAHTPPCLTAAAWTVAHQAPLAMGFQEHWSRLPFPPPRDLLDSGIKPMSPALPADSFTTEPPGKPHSGLEMFDNLPKTTLVTSGKDSYPNIWIPKPCSFHHSPLHAVFSGRRRLPSHLLKKCAARTYSLI